MGQPDGMLEWLAGCMDQDEAEACDWQDSHSPQFPSLVAPASALAQVAAHRAILAEHAPEREHVEWWDAPDETGQAAVCTSCRPADPTEGSYDPVVKPEDFVPSYTLWPCPTVRHLATMYAGREGYDPSWGPQ